MLWVCSGFVSCLFGVGIAWSETDSAKLAFALEYATLKITGNLDAEEEI